MLERRSVPTDFEWRTAGEGKYLITGYAYKFNERSQDLGGFTETVTMGAGRESAQTDDIRALMNHDPNLILGRSQAGVGTLSVGEDSTGLLYEITADERQSYVKDLIISLERGDVTQSSFAFRPNRDGVSWSFDEHDFPLRTLTSLRLFDVSPATYPAYLGSTAEVSKRAIEMAARMVSERDSKRNSERDGERRDKFPSKTEGDLPLLLRLRMAGLK